MVLRYYTEYPCGTHTFDTSPHPLSRWSVHKLHLGSRDMSSFHRTWVLCVSFQDLTSQPLVHWSQGNLPVQTYVKSPKSH